VTADDEALLARLAPAAHGPNGVPSPDDVRNRERAAEIAQAALADLLLPGGVRTSVLGPGWSRDLDLHVRALPAPDRLRDLGWLCLDDLLRRLGSPGAGRWAVVDANLVLTAADFHLSPPPDPLDATLQRCLSRREVRLREVLELRAHVRAGATLPAGHPAVAAAADAELALGGDLLSAFGATAPRMPPVPVAYRQWRAPIGALRRRIRRPYVVAVSGVDGSGKSTLVRQLAAQLERAGVRSTCVWSRPGMGLGPIEHVAAAAKRLLRQDASPGLRAMAQGQGAELRSRRGLVGSVWALVVAGAFVVDANRQHAAAAGGVVLYDRHVPDALATLDFAYEGADLRLPRAMVRHLLPSAGVTVYLDVPADVAVARKPGDTLGDIAVRRQLDSYADWRGTVPGLIVLDATRPREEIAAEALGAVLRVPK